MLTKRRYVPSVMSLLAIGFLSACDASTKTPSANDSEAIGNADQQMPEGFTLPEGTQIASSTSVDMAGGAGTVLLLDSILSPQQLEDHFAQEARAAGFALDEVVNEAGQRQLSGETPDGLMFDFATASAPDGSTRASMAVGRER